MTAKAHSAKRFFKTLSVVGRGRVSGLVIVGQRGCGLVILCIVTERAEKLKLEQIVEDYAVHKAHRMPFRRSVKTAVSPLL